MVVSEKEALYHIYHEEDLYKMGRFDKDTLRVKLEYFIEVLAGYNYSKAEEQCYRVNQKYGFSISI